MRGCKRGLWERSLGKKKDIGFEKEMTLLVYTLRNSGEETGVADLN